jgi:bifunctional DNA-binding transcriptional regulator/antitoxin component of YhaV-PrlF toxin-antitoxin module
METFYAEVIADNRITIPKVVVTVLKLRKGQRLKVSIEKV